MNRQKRTDFGITLVALVVSIVIMLILAGVSLNLTVGENGIINNALMASIKMKFAGYKEEVEMSAISDSGIYASENSLKNYISNIKDEDINKFVISKSKLMYIGSDELETKVAHSLGMGEGNDFSAVTEIQKMISGVVQLGDKFTVPQSDYDEITNEFDTANGLIGTRLYDRNSDNLLNGKWNIVDEYNSNNVKTARYGSGYYFFKKGNTYSIDGNEITFQNNYVVNYATKEFILLSENAVNWNKDSTLAVSGAVLDLDPMAFENGKWINLASGKTYEEELAIANAIVDSTEKAEALETVNTTFYNFHTKKIKIENQQEIEIWTDSKIQKTGDLVYDSNIKGLKLNESSSNTDGMGGFLRIQNGTNNFSNGFTFEIYFNPSRLYHSHSGWDPAHSETRSVLGLFCCMRESAFKSNAENGWISQVMRFCYMRNNNNLRFVGDFSNYYPGTAIFYTSDQKFSYSHGGDLAFSLNKNNNKELFEAGKDYYYTVVYERNITAEDDDYEFATGNNVDRVSFYMDGEFLGRTFYPKAGFDEGRGRWDKSDAYFQIGRCPVDSPINMFYLKGSIYSTRLYNNSMNAEQVKANYEKTLKYRSSF